MHRVDVSAVLTWGPYPHDGEAEVACAGLPFGITLYAVLRTQHLSPLSHVPVKQLVGATCGLHVEIYVYMFRRG
tara:strand:+ start:457 stop:678 length:222 start_codon:yes stop_codon:yes gene_type:complete